MSILYIKATPKTTDQSWTLKMSEYFLNEYLRLHPHHTTTELTLHEENTPYLSETDLHNMMQTDKGRFASVVDQFLAHDKYIIAAPFWNLSIPAVLKAYLDRIITVGKTFTYTESGPVPLHPGRKAAFFMARGGFYAEGPDAGAEFGLSYWNALSDRFLGLKTDAVILEGTAIMSRDEVDQAFKDKQQQIRNLAEVF